MAEFHSLKEFKEFFLTHKSPLGEIPDLTIKKGKTPIFILDTSILIHNPNIIHTLIHKEPCVLVLPIAVLEEIDELKTRPHTKREAMQIGRTLFDLTKEDTADKAGIFHIEKSYLVFSDLSPDISSSYNPQYNDNIILYTALEWQNKYSENKVTLLSKDNILMVKARAFDLQIEPELGDAYKAKFDLNTPRTWIDYTDKIHWGKKGEIIWPEQQPDENSLIYIESNGQKHYYIYHNNAYISFTEIMTKTKITGKNIAQKYAMSIILQDWIKLAFLMGKAGTGKTLIALATALQELENDKIDRIIVARPIVAMGNDIGYLPGDVNAKLYHWMQPIYDNIELLLPITVQNEEFHNIQSLIDRGYIEIASLAHIRGRSLPRQFIIIDEAQNLTPHEIKTIITRVGENSKVVFTGDPWQVDNHYLNSETNGLTVWAELARGEEFAISILLTDTVRSSLADWASNIMP